MIKNNLDTINNAIGRDLWCDFDIVEFDGFNLVIVCGIDPPVDWLFRITFKMVSFLSIKNFWKRHAKLPPLEVWNSEDASRINLLNRIEIGNILFRINHEDVNESGTNAFIVAAQDLEYQINSNHCERLTSIQ